MVFVTVRLLALEAGQEQFDVIVMDEAQDLIRPPILDLLNAWLKGGLRDGRWAFFGDFHRQAIYGSRLSGGCATTDECEVRFPCPCEPQAELP